MSHTQKIGLVVRNTHNAISRTMEKYAITLLPVEITRVQIHTIEVIFARQEIGLKTFQKDLESELSIKRSAISLMLDNMEKSNLIERKASEKDSRFKHIIITPYGVTLFKKAITMFDNVEEKFLKGFSQKDKDTLVSLLNKININIENIKD